MIPPEVLCTDPECRRRFRGDANNNLYADCPVCGNRVYLQGEGEIIIKPERDE